MQIQALYGTPTEVSLSRTPYPQPSNRRTPLITHSCTHFGCTRSTSSYAPCRPSANSTSLSGFSAPSNAKHGIKTRTSFQTSIRHHVKTNVLLVILVVSFQLRFWLRSPSNYKKNLPFPAQPEQVEQREASSFAQLGERWSS
jgi:hypothetical protein